MCQIFVSYNYLSLNFSFIFIKYSIVKIILFFLVMLNIIF
jgi:hypothetical protein